MPRFHILAPFQKDGEMKKWPKQEKFGLEPKDIKMILNKPEILIIVLSEKRNEFVGRTFCKDKIQLKEHRRMTKAGVGPPFDIPNAGSSKLHLR